MKVSNEVTPFFFSETSLSGSEKGYDTQENCRALLLNQEHDYHYEVLESILALYPLPQLSNCNHSSFNFTVIISSGEEKDFYRERSISWHAYAIDKIKKNVYKEENSLSSRYLDKVIVDSSFSTEKVEDFDYEIRASCYCKSDDDIHWLFERDSHFCVFHEACQKAIPCNRALWLNPVIHPSIFPRYLPAFEQDQSIINPSMHNLCIIGEGKRREYNLLADYLQGNKKAISTLHFHHFGIGNVQKPMKPVFFFH